MAMSRRASGLRKRSTVWRRRSKFWIRSRSRNIPFLKRRTVGEVLEEISRFMSHPFLDNDFQIRWSQLQPERVVPDIEVALVRAQEKIDALTELDLATLSFENTMLALENATEELSDRSEERR